MSTTFKLSPTKLQELLEKARAHKAQDSQTQTSPPHIVSEDRYGNVITYNEEQNQFINLALSQESCILIGAAGTGKTTCMRGAIESLSQSGKIPIIQDGDHKYLPNSGVPGIVLCSFTRRAVTNLRRAMPDNMKENCITIHKLLEFKPEYFEVIDPETGEEKKRMTFVPSRNSYNPLSYQIKTIVLDESSMISVELFQLLLDALPHRVQFIFLGDIQQLPPVFGSAILGYKMLELPTVELTQVYRQALESPIIKYATQIKDGTGFTLTEKIQEVTSKGTLTLHPWKKKLHAEVACLTFCKFITQAYDAGGYNPEEDIILVPFNKAFGTDEINKRVADHIAKKESRVVFEIIAGFKSLYFSVGDHVLYDKEDAKIVDIKHNANYLGKKPKPASRTLDYHGYDPVSHTPKESTQDEAEALLNSLADLTEDDSERVRAASHVITVVMDDSGETIELTTASELNSLLLAYAITVHKAQGSEWRKVFFIIHQSHATMTQRELLYTGFTRAREELYVICEPETFQKGVASQKIKGNTLAEKAVWFQGKKDSGSYALT